MKSFEFDSENIREGMLVSPVLMRNGVRILSIAILLLLIGAIFVPYPKYVRGEITMTRISGGYVYAKGLLPYHYVSQIKSKMPVNIQLSGYNTSDYGNQNGYINYISPDAIVLNGKNYFSFAIVMDDNAFIQVGMKGNVSIVISHKTFWERMKEGF